MASVLHTIADTPLMKLGTSVPKNSANIFAKLECFNPGGSVKDRICQRIIEDAEKAGEIKSGSTVIEPTSGNTGIGLAILCAIKGYRLILVMPENYSKERRYMMSALGAEIVLTPAADEMLGAISKANELSNEIPGSFIAHQFSNPSNPAAHRDGTAKEILAEIPAQKIDVFIAGVGTGGTLTGVGRVLKKNNPKCQVVAVEPEAAAVLSGRKPQVHKIQGIGPGFIPENLDRALIDRIITVSDEEAYKFAKKLAREEGLLMGISSGAAFFAALQLAKELGSGHNVVTVFPDRGERYFSIEKYFKNV